MTARFVRCLIACSCCIAACVLWSSFSHAEPTRAWTGDEDETIEAEFLREQDGYALLKTEERTLRVPIRRLSEADQQWLDRHEELNRPREWGKAGGRRWRGRFIEVRGEVARIKLGRERQAVPLRDLSAEDHAHLRLVYEHLGETAPDGVKTGVAPTTAAADAGPQIEREWTDKTGRRIQAAFLGTRGLSVLLLRKDRDFVYPIESLSEDDQAWIAEHNLKRLADDVQSGWRAVANLAFIATAGPSATPATPSTRARGGFAPPAPPRRSGARSSQRGRPIDLPPPPKRDAPDAGRRPIR